MKNLSKYTVKIKGVTPLIMHNCQSADPTNKFTVEAKQYKNKRSKKTEQDEIALRNNSFLAALYWDEKEFNGLYMPTDNLMKMTLEAARSLDQKTAKKEFVGVGFLNYIGYKLYVKNRDNIDLLLADPENKYIRMVNIQKSKVPSVRPIFYEWSCSFDIEIDTFIVNTSTVEEWLQYAGGRVGLCCRRPYGPTPGPFGKFIVESFEQIK